MTPTDGIREVFVAIEMWDGLVNDVRVFASEGQANDWLVEQIARSVPGFNRAIFDQLVGIDGLDDFLSKLEDGRMGSKVEKVYFADDGQWPEDRER